MDSNTRFGVLVALIIVAVGVSHWRLRAHISDSAPRDEQTVEASAETSPKNGGEGVDTAPADHYKRMVEAAVAAKDPALRKSALRYLVMMSKSDEEMDPKLVDWARTELARQKAAESPGLLGKQLELEVGGDAPKVGRLENADEPSVGRIEEPPSDGGDGDYIRWGDDEKSKGARPPDNPERGLVDPFSK